MKRRLYLRRNRASEIAVPELAKSSSAIDVTLQRLSQAAQLGLLALAVFGYFYTVLPSYQLARLTEESVKKDTDIRRSENRLKVARTELLAIEERSAELTRGLTIEISRLNQDIQIRKIDLHKQTQLLQELALEVDTARATAKTAEARAKVAFGELARLEAVSNTQYLLMLTQLTADAQLMGKTLCSLEIEREFSISKCLREKVISLQVFDSLRPEHKAQFLQAAERSANGAELATNDLKQLAKERRDYLNGVLLISRTLCETLGSSRIPSTKARELTEKTSEPEGVGDLFASIMLPALCNFPEGMKSLLELEIRVARDLATTKILSREFGQIANGSQVKR